jgi:hypothetical protein
LKPNSTFSGDFVFPPKKSPILSPKLGTPFRSDFCKLKSTPSTTALVVQLGWASRSEKELQREMEQ